MVPGKYWISLKHAEIPGPAATKVSRFITFCEPCNHPNSQLKGRSPSAAWDNGRSRQVSAFNNWLEDGN
jgi:hypothetical protein